MPEAITPAQIIATIDHAAESDDGYPAVGASSRFSFSEVGKIEKLLDQFNDSGTVASFDHDTIQELYNRVADVIENAKATQDTGFGAMTSRLHRLRKGAQLLAETWNEQHGAKAARTTRSPAAPGPAPSPPRGESR